MNRVHSILTAGFLAMLLVVPAPTHADFVVSLRDTTIVPGSTATLDVLIEGDSPGGDPLASFGFRLLLGGPTSGSGQVVFTATQPEDYLDDPAEVPPYVFLGDSANVIDGVPLAVVAPDGLSATGGDDTFSFTDVLVSESRRLVRLQVAIDPANVPTYGSTFQVTLDPDPAFTFFWDAAGFPENNYRVASQPGWTGTITVVPEPSSLALVGLGLLGGCGYAMHHRRVRAARIG